MASFTADLGLTNSSRRIIDPQNNKGPTFLEGLANLGSNLVSGGSQTYRQAQAAGRQAQADALRASQASAENAAAGLALDVRSGVYAERPQVVVPAATEDPYGQPVPIDSELAGAPPPPGVERAASEILRAQAAEDQGRAPTGSSRVILESRLAELRARYPDQQAVIEKTLREAGVDHYLFRQTDLEQKVFETRRDAELAGFTEAVSAATKAGLYLPNMSPEDAAVVGRGLMKAEYDAKMLRDQQEALRAAATEGRTQTQFNQGQLDREGANVYGNLMDQVTLPLFNYLSSRITEAGMVDDEGNIRSLEQILPEAVNGIRQVTQNTIARARAEGASQSVIDSIQARGDQLVKSATDMYSGDGSQYQVRKQALDTMQTTLGLNAMQAMPIYSGLSEILGQAAVNQIFQDNPIAFLPSGTLDRLKAELSGNISGVVDTDQEKATMATVAGILRGQLDISQLNERQASEVIKTMAPTHEANAREVANGGGNQRAYINSGIALTNAAVELQPGLDAEGFKQVPVAQNYLFQPSQLRADIEMANAGPDGQLLVSGKRAAATHTLQLGQQRQLPASLREQGWSVQYRNGRFQAELNQDTYNRWRGSFVNRQTTSTPYGTTMQIGGGSSRPEYNQARTRIPEDIRNQVWGMNLAMDYLVGTSQFDEDFKGVSPNEVRRYFGTGAIPAAMQQRQQQSRERAAGYAQRDAEGRRIIQEAVTQATTASTQALEARPRNQLENQVAEVASSMGLDFAGVQRLVQKESEWDPNARNRTTGAAGLFQINDNVTRTIEQNITDGLGMWRDAQRNARGVLNRQPTDAEAYVMYQQGAGGGRALLNPNNANRKAVDVLTEVYGNRATATQAVTANGGNANMTAREFSQSIQNYFNG